MARRTVSAAAGRAGADLARAHGVRERLAAGPARGIGAAAELAREAASSEDVRRALVEALADERAVVVARAANSLKKVAEIDARLLDAFASLLLRAALRCEVLEARWNLWLVLGKVVLGARERGVAVDALMGALCSASALERVHALQALADMRESDANLRVRVRGLLEHALEDESAAVRARARRLLKAG